MKLIIGLGNPDKTNKNLSSTLYKEYAGNRHNVGHMLVDALQDDLPRDTRAEKTTVYMNESGEEVSKLKNFYKVDLDDLYVIYDDLDIPLGSYKISKGKSPKVHNGIISVIEKLGSEDFWHVRIGVDNRGKGEGERVKGKEYVLSDFTDEEKPVLEKVIDEVVRLLCDSKE